MPGTLRQGRLKSVVIAETHVAEIGDLPHPRELAIERPGRLNSGRTGGSRGRFVEVYLAKKVCAMAAHVRQVEGHVRSDGALDADIPFLHVRHTPVLIDRSE